MRQQEGLTFLPEAGYSGHDVAEAVRQAVKLDPRPPAASGEASRIPEHLELHLRTYRELTR